MTLTNIPLAVDGALTGASLLRKGLMAAIGGGGVVRADDLKVSATVPNAQSLQISSGLAAVPNGYQPTPDEVYVVSNPTGHTITSDVMPGSSAATTYWLVCLVVGDPGYSNTDHPFMPTTFDPAQANTFQYVRAVLLPCSSTTTTFEQLGKSYPGLALARLAIPPSTTTYSDAMLTDVRTRSGDGQLIRRDVWPNVGGFNTTVGNAVTGQILWTRDLAVSANELPSNARKVFIKSENRARAAGNQQTGQYLQVRFNGTGSWVDIDYSWQHNAGDAISDMGATLSGTVDIPAGTTVLNVRQRVDVSGGGSAVNYKMTNLTLNYFR